MLNNPATGHVQAAETDKLVVATTEFDGLLCRASALNNVFARPFLQPTLSTSSSKRKIIR